jgi:hypothetical protein
MKALYKPTKLPCSWEQLLEVVNDDAYCLHSAIHGGMATKKVGCTNLGCGVCVYHKQQLLLYVTDVLNNTGKFELIAHEES